MGINSLVLKTILVFICGMSLSFCKSQSSQSDTNYKVLLDSNKLGSLYIFNDSVLFQSVNGKSFFKDFKGGLDSFSMKLKGDTLIMLYPFHLMSYSFYTEKLDTLFYSDKINFIDNLVLKDSFVISYKENVVIFNTKTSKPAFEKTGSFFEQNLLVKDSILYLLWASDYKQIDLIKINLKSTAMDTLAHFNNENVLFREEDMYWTGMYLHDNLMIIQFLKEMVVFDLVKNDVVSKYKSAYTDVELIEDNKEYILFMNEMKEKIKYVYKKNEFVKL